MPANYRSLQICVQKDLRFHSTTDGGVGALPFHYNTLKKNQRERHRSLLGELTDRLEPPLCPTTAKLVIDRSAAQVR
jgi:hypothetical protein